MNECVCACLFAVTLLLFCAVQLRYALSLPLSALEMQGNTNSGAVPSVLPVKE